MFLCVSLVFCCHTVITFIIEVLLDIGHSIFGSFSLTRTVLLSFWLEAQSAGLWGFLRDTDKLEIEAAWVRENNPSETSGDCLLPGK